MNKVSLRDLTAKKLLRLGMYRMGRVSFVGRCDNADGILLPRRGMHDDEWAATWPNYPYATNQLVDEKDKETGAAVALFFNVQTGLLVIEFYHYDNLLGRVMVPRTNIGFMIDYDWDDQEAASDEQQTKT